MIEYIKTTMDVAMEYLQSAPVLKYIVAFFISMLPIIELRGGVPVAMELGIDWHIAILMCTVANMIPVPFIYLFARKFLNWGAEKKYIGGICNFFLNKGEKAGQKLVKTAGRGGLFVALMLFVGIPIPGTGAWTGALGASFLNMGVKSTALAVCLGVLMAGIIMALTSAGVFHVIGV